MMFCFVNLEIKFLNILLYVSSRFEYASFLNFPTLSPFLSVEILSATKIIFSNFDGLGFDKV